MTKKKKEHFNKKVARNRGASWKKSLMKGRFEQQMNPSKLRMVRIHKGVSQNAAAKELSLSPSTYGDIERGKRPVKDVVAQRAAKMFGLPVSKLFKKNPENSKLVAAR